MVRVVLVALAFLGGIGIARAEPAEARVPVLVELFTSEGCSSCPPADQLLMTLQKTQPVAGAQIIPVGFHVDYWNGLGWKDEFSSPAFTQRQSDYANAFKLSSDYTPQMVVDGQAEFVGSSEAKARDAIGAAAKLPKVRIQINRSTIADTSVTLKITIPESLPAGANADLNAVLVQGNMESDVKRGENSGRKLHHTAVVRSLTRIGVVEASKRTFDVSIPLPTGLRPRDVRAVVFLQEASTRRILGSASE